MSPTPEEVWKTRLPSEIHFWDEWLRTRGLQWPETYVDALDLDRPLQDYLQSILSSKLYGGVVFNSILDVGAGPLTVIGRVWPFHIVHVTPIDPLADEYTRLLTKHGVRAPVPTQPCKGEDILEHFAPNTFDLAHAQNSLDHSFDPILIIQNMFQVVKPGGAVYLNHAVREADTQHHEGLHQHNMYANENNEFCIESDGVVVNVSESFKDAADITVEVPGWIQVTIVKK